jgi:molybdopterin synthase sulfur carrier subunit
MTVHIVYFSWVREKIGKPHEDVELPGDVRTVREFLIWMKSRGEEYEAALEHMDVIRVALDMEHVHHSDILGTPYEIALFPPMTGG